jgi:hypothetical protein
MLPTAFLAAAVAAATFGAARAQVPPEDVPLSDILDVVVIDRQVVAFDARTGGQRVEPLRREERVTWKGVRGQVGVVLTDERVLAIAAGSGAWQEADKRLDEKLPPSAILGDRVALVVTSLRAIGFDGGSGNLLETSLGPRERVLGSRTGENVAVVATDRRALGLSPQVGGFFPTKIELGERIESLDTSANLATLTTNRRVLIFRAPFGSWEEKRRRLRP